MSIRNTLSINHPQGIKIQFLVDEEPGGTEPPGKGNFFLKSDDENDSFVEFGTDNIPHSDDTENPEDDDPETKNEVKDQINQDNSSQGSDIDCTSVISHTEDIHTMENKTSKDK